MQRTVCHLILNGVESREAEMLILRRVDDHVANPIGLEVLNADKAAVFTSAAHAQRAVDHLHSLRQNARRT